MNTWKKADLTVACLFINVIGLMGLLLMFTLIVSIPMQYGAIQPHHLVDSSILWSADAIFAYCISFPCTFLMVCSVISHITTKTK